MVAPQPLPPPTRPTPFRLDLAQVLAPADMRAITDIGPLNRGVGLHPNHAADPDVYRIALSRYGMAQARVGFSRDLDGATNGVHLEGLPLSAEKRSASPTPRPLNPTWATGALSAVAVLTAVNAFRRRTRPTAAAGHQRHDRD